MRKSKYLDSCKIISIRLLESSSKFLNDNDLEVKSLSLTMRNELKFNVPTRKKPFDFSLYLVTELNALANDNDPFLIVTTKFKCDYKIIGDQKIPPEKYQDISEPLAQQFFPVVRVFLSNLLTSMGMPLPLPWSMQGSTSPASSDD